MSGHWIQSAIKHPGALTRKAEASGMSVPEFEANPPANASTKTKKQIALAKTLAGFHKKKKKG
jgi:hypothetical protein